MASHPSEELAYFCATLQGEAIADMVCERVRYLFLDHLAMAFRGSCLPSSRAVYQMLEKVSCNHPTGSQVIGTELRIEASWAALANGTAAHGLGMDDVENNSSLHPGVVIFPAALALAEQENCSPQDFYAAVVAGYEVTLRIGMALSPASTYARGFHPTAVSGCFGATAVSARLLGLSAEQTSMAFGIAGSMAAGSMAYLNGGAWTKRFHPGWACHAGITAARLAQCNFIGPASILEAPNGFLHAYSEAADVSKLTMSNEDDFALMKVSLKPYACCRYTHGPIDCLLQIISEHHPDISHITRIRCGVLSGGRSLIADPIEQKRQVKSIVEAQSSMPFSAAIVLVTGQAGQSVFTEEWVHHPMIRSLMQRVECYSCPALDDYYPAEWRASVSILMDDGCEFEATQRFALGSPENPLSWEQLEARFHELVQPVLPEDLGRNNIIAQVKNLEHLRFLSSHLDF